MEGRKIKGGWLREEQGGWKTGEDNWQEKKCRSVHPKLSCKINKPKELVWMSF